MAAVGRAEGMVAVGLGEKRRGRTRSPWMVVVVAAVWRGGQARTRSRLRGNLV